MNGDFDDLDTGALGRVLNRHRVAGPPRDLRERIVEAARDQRRARVREWLPALATAALIVLFYALAASVRAELAAQLPVPNEPAGFEQSLDPTGVVRLNEP